MATLGLCGGGRALRGHAPADSPLRLGKPLREIATSGRWGNFCEPHAARLAGISIGKGKTKSTARTILGGMRHEPAGAAGELPGFFLVEPAGIEPATSCLQRNPPARAKWRDLLGIHPPGPRTSRAKARFVSRDFAGRWSTEVDAWTSSAALWPRVLLGATDAPRR